MASEGRDYDSDDDLNDLAQESARFSPSQIDAEVVDSSVLYQPGISPIDRGWLKIDPMLMKPKKMCAVNQFVHIVQELDDPYLSSSCELVLVGTGTSIPEHFRWMVYCMEMVGFNYGSSLCFLTLFCAR